MIYLLTVATIPSTNAIEYQNIYIYEKLFRKRLADERWLNTQTNEWPYRYGKKKDNGKNIFKDVFWFAT